MKSLENDCLECPNCDIFCEDRIVEERQNCLQMQQQNQDDEDDRNWSWGLYALIGGFVLLIFRKPLMNALKQQSPQQYIQEPQVGGNPNEKQNRSHMGEFGTG